MAEKQNRQQRQFRLNLLQLGNSLRVCDVEALKFVLRGEFGDSKVEAIKTVWDLMTACIHCGIIQCQSVNELREIFVTNESWSVVDVMDRIFPPCEGRTEGEQPLVKVEVRWKENNHLSKYELDGDCRSARYRNVLDVMVSCGDHGKWEMCHRLIRKACSSSSGMTVTLRARLKIEYAVVVQFRGDLDGAFCWIRSALKDAKSISHPGGQRMLFTYVYHYAAVLAHLQKKYEKSERLLQRAKQLGFGILDAETEAHLQFAKGMLLTLKLDLPSVQNREELRQQALWCFTRSADICRSADRETAGTEWCCKRALTLSAGHYVKRDDTDLKETVNRDDINQATKYLKIVEKRRKDTQDDIGQREGEVLAIKACIAMRQKQQKQGLEYAKQAKKSAQTFGLSTDLVLFQKQEKAYEKFAVETGSWKKNYACWAAAMVITGLLYGIQYIAARAGNVDVQYCII